MKCKILLVVFAGLVCVSAHAESETVGSRKVLIKGKPTARNAVLKRGTPYAEILGFVVDRRRGGVGASVEVREDPLDADSVVASLVFSFSQLRYDKHKRQIMLGDIVVEKRGIFRWWRNPDYQLTLKATELACKETFGGAPSIMYDVYLATGDTRAQSVLAGKSKAGSPPEK